MVEGSKRWGKIGELGWKKVVPNLPMLGASESDLRLGYLAYEHHNMPPAMALDRLWCAPPCRCTALPGPLENMTPTKL